MSKINPLAKCATCGHSRWQHQDLRADMRPAQATITPVVEPRKCRKDGCTCRQYVDPEDRATSTCLKP